MITFTNTNIFNDKMQGKLYCKFLKTTDHLKFCCSQNHSLQYLFYFFLSTLSNIIPSCGPSMLLNHLTTKSKINHTSYLRENRRKGKTITETALHVTNKDRVRVRKEGVGPLLVYWHLAAFCRDSTPLETKFFNFIFKNILHPLIKGNKPTILYNIKLHHLCILQSLSDLVPSTWASITYHISCATKDCSTLLL